MFACLEIVSHMSVWGTIKGAGSRTSKGRGGANTLQDGAVDLQHGTGVEEN